MVKGLRRLFHEKKKVMITIECEQCGWLGSYADLIAEWSDIEPHCPECWNSRAFLEEEEDEI